jgi:glycosyltransferase involved in cell wall biosynthesis
MTEPLVTLAMPVYNGEQWLNQAIGTLVKQSYDNTEIIIADDCSTDNSRKICEQYAKKFSQIKFIQNETNLGAQHNFRKILKLSSGKYIAYASQDDFWDIDFLSCLVAKLESNDSAVLAASAVQLLDKNDKKFEELHFNGKWNPEKLNVYGLIFSLMLPLNFGKWLKDKHYQKWIKNNLFFHGVLRTDILRFCYNIFPGIVGHDRHFLLLLALSGKWCYVDRILYYRRVDGGGIQLKRLSNDPVYKRKKNIFHPIIALFQMLTGVIKHHNSKISARLFSIPIIIMHVFYELLKPVRSMAVKTFRFFYQKIYKKQTSHL